MLKVCFFSISTDFETYYWHEFPKFTSTVSDEPHHDDAKEILQGKAYHWREWSICRGRDCLYAWSDSAALELSNGSNGWFRFILDGKLATMYSSGSPENGNDNSGICWLRKRIQIGKKFYSHTLVYSFILFILHIFGTNYGSCEVKNLTSWEEPKPLLFMWANVPIGQFAQFLIFTNCGSSIETFAHIKGCAFLENSRFWSVFIDKLEWK